MSNDLPGFIRRDVERAMDEAIHPKGMSVHDGKASIGADRLNLMLCLIDRLRAENAAQALLIASLKEELRKSEMQNGDHEAAIGQLLTDVSNLTQQLSDAQAALKWWGDGKREELEEKLSDTQRNNEELMQRVGKDECTWAEADSENMPGTYEGACGIMWSFTEGGIDENECLFCPRCGGRIAASKVSNEGAESHVGNITMNGNQQASAAEK
jgi:hypothetical protein